MYQLIIKIYHVFHVLEQNSHFFMMLGYCQYYSTLLTIIVEIVWLFVDIFVYCKNQLKYKLCRLYNRASIYFQVYTIIFAFALETIGVKMYYITSFSFNNTTLVRWCQIYSKLASTQEPISK